MCVCIKIKVTHQLKQLGVKLNDDVIQEFCCWPDERHILDPSAPEFERKEKEKY